MKTIKCSKNCSSGRYDKEIYNNSICRSCGAEMVEIKKQKRRRTLLMKLTFPNGKIIKRYA